MKRKLTLNMFDDVVMCHSLSRYPWQCVCVLQYHLLNKCQLCKMYACMSCVVHCPRATNACVCNDKLLCHHGCVSCVVCVCEVCDNMCNVCVCPDDHRSCKLCVSQCDACVCVLSDRKIKRSCVCVSCKINVCVCRVVCVCVYMYDTDAVCVCVWNLWSETVVCVGEMCYVCEYMYSPQIVSCRCHRGVLSLCIDVSARAIEGR